MKTVPQTLLLMMAGTPLAASIFMWLLASLDIAHDPYFSVWSITDKLTDSDPSHWTGKPNSLSAAVRVDGKLYRVMGREQRQSRRPSIRPGLRCYPPAPFTNSPARA